MTTNNISLDDRNADLVPEILNALAHNKAGNSEQRDICLCNINHKLMERGDEPNQFWTSFQECMNIVSQAK